MMHFTCDVCGKQVSAGGHFVVKIEAFAAADPAELTEADLDDDHLETMSALLSQAADEGIELSPPSQQLRYDLCAECHERYLRDPLGREQAPKAYFSEN